MNTQPLIITDPAKYAVLVNPERIRSSVKRLFRNNISESLSESFQNSQRAGAKNVAIVITPDGFSIQDDGHGILDGIEGFQTLLKLAESSFDNPTIEDQDPMGIGIASLLTHDQIEEVSFASGNLRLAIDPSRWWSEKSYYSTWFERIETLDEPVTRFLIYVRCKAELIAELKKALEPKERSIFATNIFEIMSPAQGYEGVLTITLDSEPVITSLPTWATARETAIETTYQGCRLVIGYNKDDHYHRSCVRWYGQLIEVKQTFGNFNFYLDVDQGRPVNPLSPTRSGIITDNAFKTLIEFVVNEIFRFVCDPANRPKIQSGHVDSLHRIDDARALTECPYITARELLPMNLPDSFEDSQRVKGEASVFTYDDVPLLINDGVTVILKNSIVANDYGHQVALLHKC